MERIKEYSELISLFDKQLQFAQNIQKKIIPKAQYFHSDDYHLHTYLKPFRKVGGDFYDFHELEDDKMSLILADATGHGIDAAMITSMVKLIYTYGMKDETIRNSPAALMAQIDSDIEQQLTSTFFSAIALVLDPVENTLRFSNAGHPSGLLIGETIRQLKPTLPLLGLHQMMSSIEYEDELLPFVKGDKLLLYTDGLIDAQNDKGEVFSMDRLMDCVEARKNEPITPLCNHIIKTLTTFTNNAEANDDICMLGIDYDI